MATLAGTLAGTLRKNAQGELVEQQPTLSQLAGKVGVVPPLTAVGAGLLGGNANQQKMAGTPQQVQSALTQANTPKPQTLQETLRQQQNKPQTASTAEQAKIQQAQGLQGLSNLGDRVQSLIGSYLAPAQPGQLQITANTSAELLKDKTPEQVATFKANLEQYLANPQDLTRLDAATKAIGSTEPINPAQVKDLLADAASVVGNAAAGAIQNQLTVQNLVEANHLPGYDLGQLGKLLEMDPAEVGKLDVPGLQQKIAEVERKDFQEVDNLRSLLSDPATSPAERAMARQQLAHYSEVGLTTADQSVSELRREIQDADLVHFGGKDYTVGNLLSDETISGIVQNYLRAPDSPENQALKHANPDFIAWVEKNRDTFNSAVSAAETGAATYQKTNEYNRGLANIQGVQLDPDIMQKILPDQDKLGLSASQIDPTTIGAPIYQALRGPQGPQIAIQLNNLNRNGFGSIVGELIGLDPEQIRNLGLADNSPKFQKYMQLKQQQKDLSLINPTKPDGEKTVLGLITGQQMTPRELEDHLELEKSYKNLGIESHYDEIVHSLDKNGDGKPDTPSQLYKWMARDLESMKLSDFTTTTDPAVPGKYAATHWTGDAAKSSPIFQMMGVATGDGKITPNEIAHANITPYIDNMQIPQEFTKKYPEAAKGLESRAEDARIHKYLSDLPFGAGKEHTIGDIQQSFQKHAGNISSEFGTAQEAYDQRHAMEALSQHLQELRSKAPFPSELERDLSAVQKSVNRYVTALSAYKQKTESATAVGNAEKANNLNESGIPFAPDEAIIPYQTPTPPIPGTGPWYGPLVGNGTAGEQPIFQNGPLADLVSKGVSDTKNLKKYL